MKCNNICMIRIPKGEAREQGIQSLFKEIMTKNVPTWQRNKTHKSRNYRQSQTRWTQRSPHQDIS